MVLIIELIPLNRILIIKKKFNGSVFYWAIKKLSPYAVSLYESNITAKQRKVR